MTPDTLARLYHLALTEPLSVPFPTYRQANLFRLALARYGASNRVLGPISITISPDHRRTPLSGPVTLQAGPPGFYLLPPSLPPELQARLDALAQENMPSESTAVASREDSYEKTMEILFPKKERPL